MDPLITSDPAVMLGKPVIAGTRITVELIQEKVAAGETVDDLLRDYPHLTRESVAAALAVAPPFRCPRCGGWAFGRDPDPPGHTHCNSNTGGAPLSLGGKPCGWAGPWPIRESV